MFYLNWGKILTHLWSLSKETGKQNVYEMNKVKFTATILNLYRFKILQFWTFCYCYCTETA